MNRSALIAVLLTLSLAACGEKTAQTAPAAPVAAPATEQAPVAETEAAPAAAPATGTEAAPAVAPAPAK